MSLYEKSATDDLSIQNDRPIQDDLSIQEKIFKWVSSKTTPVGYLHYGTLRVTSDKKIIDGYKASIMNSMEIEDISFEELIGNYRHLIFCQEFTKELSTTELFSLLIMGVPKDDESDKRISFMMLYNDNMCTFHLSRFRPCYGPSWDGPPPNELSFALLRLDDSGNPVDRVILTTINTKL